MQQNDDAARTRVKQERDTSPRLAAVPGDKENSEPMETASTIAEMLAAAPAATSTAIPPRISTTQSGMNASSSASSTDSPARFASPQKNSSRSSLQAKAAMMAAIGTPEMRSVTGTPQSLTQLFANLPSSAFTFDLPDFQSPTGSGLLSPIGSARLGKKRPLSISPLSCSSVNIDALVRGSPTSLMGYLAGSRSSSAGSFGHLSPSLYITPNVQGFSRPMISLAKAVHPAANSLPGGNPLMMEQRARQTANTQIKQEDVQSQCSRRTNSQSGSESMSQDGDPAVDIEVAANVIISSTSNYSETDQNKRAYIPASKANHKPNRIYYSYPSTEQPHNNKCRWRDCTRQCESLDDLVRHVNTDHVYQDSKREYVCHWEGCVRDKRSFKAQYMLLVHMRRHTGEKPHKCHFEGCDKAYSRLENLKTHVRSHTGERPYVCKYESCGKAFSNASDCAKHMNRTHSDEKPYACLNAGCTKRYTDPSSRRKHMKNCQVNKRVHTMEADTTSGADESASEGQTGSLSSSSKKAAPRPRKIDRKKREEIHHYPTHSSNDLGYSSGGSHTASFVSHMTGNAHHSEYSSSGYDTEYSDQPNTVNFQTDQIDCSPMVWSPPVSIKEEFYPPMTYHQSSNQMSPMGHVTNGHVLQTNIYQVPPRPRISRHSASKPSNLSTLPEMAMPPLVNGYIVAGTPSHNTASFPDPFVDMRSSLPPSDDTASLNSSLNSSGRHNSLKSEYSNSRSSFSPYSSRVSSAAGSNHSHDHSLSSHRTIQPPDHILRHHHQSANSIQPFDLKHPPRYYRRQSDEMSMRSSHSSRYSGSEYSDDYATHLPVQPNAFSPHHPLPLPQSMQSDFAMTSTGYFEQTSPPQHNAIHSSGAPSIASEQSDDAVGGSLPLHHYELGPTPFSKPSLTIPDVILYDRATSPNMVIGNMSTFTEQLHQESMLLGGLAATGSALS